MQINGLVGVPAASAAPGTAPFVRQSHLGEIVVSEGAGRYYEPCYRKQLFRGSNVSGTPVATTAALATTYTGLVLANPPGSAVNLVLNKLGIAQVVAQTGVLAFGLMTGFNASTALSATTAGSQGSQFVGGSAGVGQVYTAATLPTAPSIAEILGMFGTAALTAPTFINELFDLEGSIILPPGGYAALYTSAASVASSFYASMQWEEKPL